MKKVCIAILALLLILTIMVSCSKKQTDVLSAGDAFSVTGMVEYFDQPSDIGKEYCSIAGSVKIEYLYIDIYGEESQWSSDTFFTQGNDTDLLKEYVGQQVTVSGFFASESHGIPYIKNITIK